VSGTLLQTKKGHPEGVTLTQALRDDEDRAKSVSKSGVRKTATLVKAPEADTTDLGVGGTMAPTDEQLGRINQFTRRKVSANEVVAFTTLSCNDAVDRDDDQFSTQCVQDFAALDGAASSVGKSYMVDHRYEMASAVGRIFGVDTKKADGTNWLTNEVYIPKTDQFAPLIEKIDFGIAWAVSVGVVLGKTACTVCGAGFSSYGYWCQNGHDKGAFYLADGETDSWGYPLPVDSRTKGAIKCVQQFSNPRDFYELSQVFLGAQYDASLDKGLVAAAKSAGVPMLGVSADEAKSLDMPHSPEELLKARAAGIKIKTGDDGMFQWKDSTGVRYVFDPSDPKAGTLCLGKGQDDENEEEVDNGEEREEQLPEGNVDQAVEHEGADGVEDGDLPEEGGADEVSGEGAVDASAAAADDEESDDEEADEVDSDEDEEDSEDTVSEDESVDDDEEEEDVSKETVVASATKARLPKSVVEAAKSAKGNGLDALLLAASKAIKTSEKKVEAQATKAALGDEYLKSLRADAITMFVKAKQEGTEPVSTVLFEKMLDKFGDDVELIRSVIEEHTTAAQKKFGKAVVRSSFATDPNERKESKESDTPMSDVESSKVSRLHS
jgi:hypothetical protein